VKRKRLLALAGIAVAAAVLVPAALDLLAYRQKVAQKLARGRLIDRDHCDRIEEGMRQEEVEAILGGPPGDFMTDDAITYADPVWHDGERCEFWSGDEGQILVRFDGQGAVRRQSFDTPHRRHPLSVAGRVRAWLRRVWP
jgi:hypothetical protein